jgi:hypothetical protein
MAPVRLCRGRGPAHLSAALGDDVASPEEGSGDGGWVSGPRCSWRSALGGICRPCNPLRRRSDRLETVAAAASGGLVLIALPFALMAGIHTHRAGAIVATEQARSRTATTATVLDNPQQPGWRWVTPTYHRIAEVAWTDWAGRTQSRSTSVPAHLHRGSRTIVWTTMDGRLVEAPTGPAAVYLAAIGTGLAAEAAAVAVAAVAFVSVRWALDRRRERSWECALDVLLKNPAGQDG